MALHERSHPERQKPDPLRPEAPASADPPPETDADDDVDSEEPGVRAWVQAAKAGDRDAFRCLVENYQDRVFRYLLRMLRCDRDTAADLSQETFLRMFRGLAAYEHDFKFATWLYRIATNVGITAYRAKHAQKRAKRTFSLDAPLAGTEDFTRDPEDHAPRPDDRAHHKEIAAAVRDAIEDLPIEFRQAVLLRDLQGLSYEEISEILEVPAGTVRSRIHRGRTILQRRLSEFRP